MQKYDQDLIANTRKKLFNAKNKALAIVNQYFDEVEK